VHGITRSACATVASGIDGSTLRIRLARFVAHARAG
jgi:hypothetical protein